MLFPELLAFIELNISKRYVCETSKALRKINAGRHVITESYFEKLYLRVIDKLVVIADFKKSFARLTCKEAISRIKEFEYLD